MPTTFEIGYKIFMTNPSDAANYLAKFSNWIDTSPGYANIDPEAHLSRRVTKTGQEFGEALEAMYGSLGENPRKGVTHTQEDLIYELLDTANAALGAVEYITGNQATALALLFAHIEKVARRAGVIE